MAHNLNFNSRTGRYSFFSVKEKAWHNLGQIIEDYPTSAEAIINAELDYEVVKSPLFTTGSNIIETAQGIEIGDSQLHVPNYFANIRTNNNAVLGPMSRSILVRVFHSTPLETKKEIGIMVFVFKTDVRSREVADDILEELSNVFLNCRINFDLNDCDNILQIESQTEIVQHVIELLKDKGFCCEELPY